MKSILIAAVLLGSTAVLQSRVQAQSERFAIFVGDGAALRDPSTDAILDRSSRGEALVERDIVGDRVEGFDIWLRRRVVVDRKSVLDYTEAEDKLSKRIDDKPTADDYVDRAIFYRHLERYEDALRDANEAVRLNENLARAYYVRSEIRSEWAFSKTAPDKTRELFAAAGKDAERCVKLAPDEARFRFTLAMHSGEPYDPTRGIKQYTEAIRLKPSYSAAYNNRAKHLIDAGRDEEALRDLDRALSLDPNYSDAFTNRGIVYHHQRDYARAISDASSAIRTNPQNPSAWNNRAQAYLELKRYDDAIRDFTEMIPLSPSEARYGLANAYYFAEQYDRSLEQCDEALKIHPGDPRIYNTRGNALKKQYKYNEAVDALDRAVELACRELAILNPSDSEMIGKIIRLDDDAQSPKTSSYHFAQLATILVNRGDAHRRLWDQTHRVDSQEAADGDLRRAILCKPDASDSYLTRSAWLRMDGNASGADHVIDEAGKVVRDYAGLLNNYSWMLAVDNDDRVRDGVVAVKYAEQACRLTDWKLPQSLDTLAAAHAEAGDFDAAIARQNEAINLWPKEVDDEELRSRLNLYRAMKPYRKTLR